MLKFVPVHVVVVMMTVIVIESGAGRRSFRRAASVAPRRFFRSWVEQTEIEQCRRIDRALRHHRHLGRRVEHGKAVPSGRL